MHHCNHTTRASFAKLITLNPVACGLLALALATGGAFAENEPGDDDTANATALTFDGSKKASATGTTSAGDTDWYKVTNSAGYDSFTVTFGYERSDTSSFHAIEVLDALANATGVQVESAQMLVDRYPGMRGIVAVPGILSLVDGGAESPQETRTRLLLIDAGLPRPSTQIRVSDESGRVFARCDLGWPQWKVVVEYDGIQHWTSEKQRTWDIERYDRLERAGWLVVQ